MRARGGVGASEDGPFVAAVSEMWFVLKTAGWGGDGSLYHSAICYFV